MTERTSLFRREALEFRAGKPRHGGVLRIDAPWTRWSYWTVLALLAAGVAVSALVRTSETTSGRARIDVQQRSFVALVPDAASRDLRRGQLVRLQLDGPGRQVLAARVIRAEVAGRARLRRAGFASSSQPAMLVTGQLERHADVTSLRSPPPEARAVVVIRSQRILGLFLRQARGMLGTGGDT
jgi:hypothetical protein